MQWVCVRAKLDESDGFRMNLDARVVTMSVVMGEKKWKLRGRREGFCGCFAWQSR